MNCLELVFWISAGVLLYTYAGYAFILKSLTLLRGRPHKRGAYTGSVSIILVAHNEERNLARRLEELTGLIHRSHVTGEVIVVSDGSTDRTIEIAERFALLRQVQVVARPFREGK